MSVLDKGTKIDPDRLLDELHDAYHAGDVDDAKGGVHATTLAERMYRTQGAITRRLNDLAKEGRVVRVWGIAPDGRPRQSWEPLGGDGL